MALPFHYEPCDAGRFATSYSRRPPLRHSSRSWTDNGVHYTVNTASYSIPSVSFGAMTRNSSAPLGDPFTMPVRSPNRASSFMGNAFGLLEDMLSMQEHHRNVLTKNIAQENERRQVEIERERESESTNSSEDHLAYEKYANQQRARPQSVFSKIKSRFLDAKQKPKTEEVSRERSPAKKIPSEREQTTQRPERKESTRYRPRPKPPAQAMNHDRMSSSSEDEHHDIHPPRQSEVDGLLIQALENAVEVQRQAVKSCKRRLEQATRQPNASSSLLQCVIDDMKRHEISLAKATNSLRKAKSEQRRSAVPQQRPRPQSYHPRTAPARQPSARQTTPPSQPPPPPIEEHFIFTPLDIGIEPGWHPEHDPDPVFTAFEQLHGFQPFARPQSFGTYDQFFGGGNPDPASDPHFSFFAMPNSQPHEDPRKSHRYSQMPRPNTSHRESIPHYRGTSFTPPPPKTSHGNPSANYSYKHPPQSSRRHSSANYQAYTPPQPRPPANLMRSEEAKHLYKIYTDRWNSLSPLDPNIPYPARALAAASLSARDTLYAPDVDVSISTWSEETVMQANAQAFYLGVVGLKPAYSEIPGTGRVECGFEKGRATAPQIKELMELLKKEKIRWHSDRLGRRNLGLTGGAPVNEGLQKDERARAVFHAVCELMERAAE